MSLLQFEAQCAELNRDVLAAYWHTVRMVTKSPWQALPAQVLVELRSVGLPVEIRDPHALAQAARASPFAFVGGWIRRSSTTVV